MALNYTSHVNIMITKAPLSLRFFPTLNRVILFATVAKDIKFFYTMNNPVDKEFYTEVDVRSNFMK